MEKKVKFSQYFSVAHKLQYLIMYGVQLLRLPTGYWNWVDLGNLTPNGPPASRCITGPKIVMEDGQEKNPEHYFGTNWNKLEQEGKLELLLNMFNLC